VTKIEAAVNETMKKNSVPGMAIGIINNGQIVYSKGFGLAEVDTDRKVTAETVFELGSTSKTVVATAIMQLKEQGKIDLDAPVITYLPYFQMKSGDYKKITIRNLLSHWGGLPSDKGLADPDSVYLTPEYDDQALERHVLSLKGIDMVSDPNLSGHYSDLGFEILGDVIAKVSGQSFEDYTQEHIFKPLGMAYTTYLIKDVPSESLATPHTLDGANIVVNSYFPYTRQLSPSSQLLSTAEDMSRFALAQLNHGQLGDARILQESSYQEMWGKTYSIDVELPNLKGYGLGWGISEMDNHKLYNHPGGVTGFRSDLLIAPDDGIAVVLMGNRLHYSFDLQFQILQILLDASPKK
jgi:CubicO group peptidase (beta-lactamase class C family)